MKNKLYEYDCALRGPYGGELKTVHLVKAPNGREVAVCQSETMAKRVAKGLNLELAERKKMECFRI